MTHAPYDRSQCNKDSNLGERLLDPEGLQRSLCFRRDNCMALKVAAHDHTCDSSRHVVTWLTHCTGAMRAPPLHRRRRTASQEAGERYDHCHPPPWWTWSPDKQLGVPSNHKPVAMWQWKEPHGTTWRCTSFVFQQKNLTLRETGLLACKKRNL